MEKSNLSYSTTSLPERVDKTLNWFKESRDSWREKNKTSKYELKKQKLAVKRARKNRDDLLEKLLEEQVTHNQLQDDLKKKDAEISKLQSQLEQINKEVNILKKKN